MIYPNSSSHFKDRVALISECGKRITYGSLDDEVNGIANIFSSKCLVFNLCNNEFESVVGYLAFIKSKVVPVMLDINIQDWAFENLYHLYQPEYIWANNKRIKKDWGNPIFSYGEYSLIKTIYLNSSPINNNLAILLATSGSTGNPRLVRISYENIRSNTESIIKFLEISKDDVAITNLPINYSYGLSILNTHLNVGGAVVITNSSMLEKKFWSLVENYGVTGMGGVPYSYTILKRLNFRKMNLPSLKKLTQAGGKLSSELVKEFLEICREKEIKFYVMYGQTEATARISYVPPECLEFKSASIGVEIPGGTLEILYDKDIAGVEADQIGELIYKGPNVSMGYADARTDLGRGNENNGVLSTGDLAKVDADGFYYICGRKTRFIKIYGVRTNLDDIEMHLNSNNFECACVGGEDSLEIYTPQADKIELIKEHVVNSFGFRSQIIKVKVVSCIPRNLAGKVLYTQLSSEA